MSTYNILWRNENNILGIPPLIWSNEDAERQVTLHTLNIWTGISEQAL